MKVVTTVAGMQRHARLWRRQGIPIGLVPTMGCLHDGHLSLVRLARRRVGASGKVVLSLFVNPTQFGPGEDFRRYPRNMARDKALSREAGVDVLFAPVTRELYAGPPAEPHTTFIVENQISRCMEGRSRPLHFQGVLTVVAKLFNLVQPDLAVFGAKDYQQSVLVRRMVRDLNVPVRIAVAPIVREPDGLALSSRNRYLKGAQREQATVLWESIRAARTLIRSRKQPVRAGEIKRQVRQLMRRRPDARLDYIELFDPETLKPLTQASRGTHMALAVYVGKTRLIDNGRL